MKILLRKIGTQPWQTRVFIHISDAVLTSEFSFSSWDLRMRIKIHAVVSIQDGWLAEVPSAAKERCLDYLYH